MVRIWRFGKIYFMIHNMSSTLRILFNKLSKKTQTQMSSNVV